MASLDMGFWIQLFVYGITFGVFGGTVLTKLQQLEKKQDKHNSLIERMTSVEARTKYNSQRIDALCEERKDHR